MLAAPNQSGLESTDIGASKSEVATNLEAMTLFVLKDAFFSKIVPNSSSWERPIERCVGLERPFFFRNPTFSGVFEKNNIRMIENIFMQYFLSSLAIC